MADYCLSKMKVYTDQRTGQEVREAYDYMEYTRYITYSYKPNQGGLVGYTPEFYPSNPDSTSARGNSQKKGPQTVCF